MRKCVKQEPFGDTKDPLSPLRTLEEPIFFVYDCMYMWYKIQIIAKLLHFLKILLNCAGTVFVLFFLKKKKVLEDLF